MLVAKDDLAGAARAYNDDFKIAAALAAKDPTNTEWQNDLFISCERGASMSGMLGNLSGATKLLQLCLPVVESLTKTDPTNTQWQIELAKAHGKLGVFSDLQGDPAGALIELAKGRDIVAPLAQKFPENKDVAETLTWFDGEIAKLKPTETPGRDATPEQSAQ